VKVATNAWQERLDRAEHLAVQHAASSDVLRFYAKLLAFQRDLAVQLNDDVREPNQLAPFAPQLLQLLLNAGTPELKQIARDSASLDFAALLDTEWEMRTAAAWSAASFPVTALLQSFAHHRAAISEIDFRTLQPICPFCQCPPQLGVLRPEGDGGKRYLLCSLCGTEWEYRRVICANCEESDKEKLPVFKNEKAPYIQLAACDTCHAYLKCVDLGVDGHAVPQADDVATLSMSLWMNQHGFHPIKLNLFGF